MKLDMAAEAVFAVESPDDPIGAIVNATIMEPDVTLLTAQRLREMEIDVVKSLQKEVEKVATPPGAAVMVAMLPAIRILAETGASC